MTDETGPRMLGQWLDTTMANRDLKNRAFARKVQVHESAVHNWRKGKNVPQLPTLQHVAQLLGADPVRLAVTAGLLDSTLVGVEPLPIPEPVARRAKARHRAEELIDELTQLTEEIRNIEDGELDSKTAAALNAIRRLVTEG